MGIVMFRDIALEYRPISALLPYSRNARTHPEEQILKIVRSMQEYGWTNPVLVDGANGLIAGHARLLAAKRLGIDRIPCIELKGLSEAQKRAYVLADNKLALDGGWDLGLLKIELTALQSMNFDLSLTGFGDFDIGRILGPAGGLTDEDDAPPVPAIPVTRLGDVWELGRHRLVCGDATKAEDVAKALGGVKPHLMVTDPPYGVAYDAAWRVSAPSSTKRGGRLSVGKHATGVVTNDDRSDWREAWAHFPGDIAYVWHGGLHTASVDASLRESGFAARCQIIWAKNCIVIGRGDYHWQHEVCWYGVRKGKTGHWTGDRTQSSVWFIDKARASETGHSTQKPVECMRKPMENNSSPGQAVYEPFAGSFTTGIAAETTGRACHALEIDPGYVDVGVTRWMNFTGQEAMLAETGETFAAVKERRQASASATCLANSRSSEVADSMAATMKATFSG
jgi:DNA modification methylase